MPKDDAEKAAAEKAAAEKAAAEKAGGKTSGRGLGLAVLLVVSVAIGLVLVGLTFSWQGVVGPVYILPMLLIVGVVVLLAALACDAVILNLLGLSNRKQALGLPAGSVRAVIALSLILVFSIIAVFMFTQQAQPGTVQSKGLTAELVQTLPKDQVVAIVAEPSTSPAIYDVTVEQLTPASTQIAMQLITILGTLVTAVAAFYFGASTGRSTGAS